MPNDFLVQCWKPGAILRYAKSALLALRCSTANLRCWPQRLNLPLLSPTTTFFTTRILKMLAIKINQFRYLSVLPSLLDFPLYIDNGIVQLKHDITLA